MANKKQAPANPAKAFIIVRIRGEAQTRANVRSTLLQLHISRKNHVVIVPATVQYTGMVKLVKDFIAYGEADEKTVKSMLDYAKISDEILSKTSDYKNTQQLAKDLVEGKTILAKNPALPSCIRLKPPKKGFGQIKQQYPKGALGYRGSKISQLVQTMM